MAEGIRVDVAFVGLAMPSGGAMLTRIVVHYAVDHTPAIFCQSASANISEVVVRYLDPLVEGRPEVCFRAATVMESGVVHFSLDESPGCG